MIADEKNIPTDLNGLPVFLSASFPEELLHTPRAQELYFSVVVFTRRILAAGGRLVFGGHPSMTPLVRRAALSVGGGQVDLYQLNRFRDKAPKEILDKNVFHEIHWFGEMIGKEQLPIGEELAEMREVMVAAAQTAVFIGGKTTGFSGAIPGIRDEYQRFLKRHPKAPVYLVGMMAGATLDIIRELDHAGQSEPNGLSEEERRIVCYATDIERIAPLVVKDMARLCKKGLSANRMTNNL